MANPYTSISTDGYITSTADEDILQVLEASVGWDTEGGNVPAKFAEIFVKDECKFLINGFPKTLLAGSELQISNKSINSIITVTDSAEYYVTFEF